MHRQPLRRSTITVAAAAGCLLFANLANAHPHHGDSISGPHGFFDGWLHPLAGLDHLLAVVILGLLATQLRDRLRFGLPLGYCSGLAAGCGIGVSYGVIGSPQIASSLVLMALGVFLVTRRLDPILPAAGLLAGCVHGLSHGVALEPGTGALTYGLGLVGMTGVLIAGGVAAGLLVKSSKRKRGWLVAATATVWLVGVWSCVPIQ